MTNCNSLLYLFQCVFSLQFISPEALGDAAGQEHWGVYLACSTNSSPCNTSVPSWFLWRWPGKCTFPFSPPPNPQQILWMNAHTAAHIDPMCEENQLSFLFFPLFCHVDLDIRNMHAHCHRNLLHPWALMSKGWTFSIFFQLLFVPSFILSFLELAVSVWYRHFLFHLCKSRNTERNLS